MTSTSKKKKKKRKNKTYFGKEVQHAVIKYNEISDDNPIVANSLFERSIYPAFIKLAENVINTWKIRDFDTNFTDLQNEVVAFMYTKIGGYDVEQGRAYSYFTIICRNYLFGVSKRNKIARDRKVGTEYIDYERDIDTEVQYKMYQENLKEFLSLWCDWYLENYCELHTNQNDQKIAESVIDLIRSHNELDIYNKKLLYVLIRERTGLSTQLITRVVKMMRDTFYDLFDDFNTTGKFLGEEYLLENGYTNKFF